MKRFKEWQQTQEKSIPISEAYKIFSKENEEKVIDLISTTDKAAHCKEQWVTLWYKAHSYILSELHLHQTKQTTPVKTEGKLLKS